MSETQTPPYPPEVAQLFDLREPEFADGRAVWPDFRAMGLTAAHHEYLLRLAEDDGPDDPDDDLLDDDNVWWARYHACCALGQLQVAEAAPRVLELLNGLIGFDAFCEEVPHIMSAMGPSVIDAVLERTVDPDWDFSARTYAVDALARIARDHPDAREKCLEELERLLSRHGKHEPVFNGLVVSALIDVKHAGAIDLIRTAYASGDVDLSICGDIEDVEIGLGLRLVRETPRPRYELIRQDDDDYFDDTSAAMSLADLQAKNPYKGVGRNDPCPCGSGKKFKKCCLLTLE